MISLLLSVRFVPGADRTRSNEVQALTNAGPAQRAAADADAVAEAGAVLGRGGRGGVAGLSRCSRLQIIGDSMVCDAARA